MIIYFISSSSLVVDQVEGLLVLLLAYCWPTAGLLLEPVAKRGDVGETLARVRIALPRGAAGAAPSVPDVDKLVKPRVVRFEDFPVVKLL